MANACDLKRSGRGAKRLQGLVTFARREGWRVERTPGGHLKFSKAGCAPIYTGSTPGDHRAARNVLARLRRTGRQASGDSGRDEPSGAVPPESDHRG